MKKWFICPDGQQIVIGDCLKKCRMGARCAPKSYLLEVSHERQWKGNGSCTQLIGGTREAYLKIVTDYAVNPAEKTLSVVGSRAHSKLEKNQVTDSFVEETLEYQGISSTLDILEFEDGEEQPTLIDTKTVSAYKMAKALGIVKDKFEEPIIGEDGKPVLIKSGPNKGQPKTKTRTEYRIDPTQAEIDDYIYQLNFNRINVEKNLGYIVKDMKVFLICRESAMSRRMYGIESSTAMISIPYMSEQDTINFFSDKNNSLKFHVENKKIPPVCSAVETWDGKKCFGFCDVSDLCREIGDNPYFSESEVSNG